LGSYSIEIKNKNARENDYFFVKKIKIRLLVCFLLSKKIRPKKEVYLLPLDFWDSISLL